MDWATIGVIAAVVALPLAALATWATIRTIPPKRRLSIEMTSTRLFSRDKASGAALTIFVEQIELGRGGSHATFGVLADPTVIRLSIRNTGRAAISSALYDRDTPVKHRLERFSDMCRHSAAVVYLVAVPPSHSLTVRASAPIVLRVTRRPRLVLIARPASTYGANAARNAVAFLARKSISYVVPSSAKSTVSPYHWGCPAVEVVGQLNLYSLDHGVASLR
jgi:hypothetical protein